MIKAIPVSENDWKYAVRVKTNLDLFNFILSRNYISKEYIPAQKVHPVEFFKKP